MDRRRLLIRAGGVAALGCAALLGMASASSAANAGTAELDNWTPPFVTNNNHPHLSCSFAVQLFNFDTANKANTATVTFTGQSPTGQGVHIPITLGPTGSFSFPDAAAAPDSGKVVNGPRGTGWAQHFQLDTSVLGAPQPNQGFHVSVDAVVNGATLKQKTVWVQPCPTPPGPNMSLEKTGPATGLPGGQGTYDLVAANEGDGAAPASTIVDTLPAGETFVSASGDLTGACTVTGHDVSCPIGTLAPHSSKTVHVVVSYDSALADLTQLTDCATVTGSLDNPCVTTTLHKPNVTLAKTGPATGIAGGQGTYDIKAENNGSADATNQTITDTLPDGETFVSATGATCTATSIAGGGQTVSCPIGTLAAGASKTVGVVVTYAANLPDNTSLKDCATVTGSTDNPCVTTKVNKPKVHLTKTGPATGLPGGQGTYDLVATNDGGADATSQTIVDTLPDGESFVSATGAVCTATNIAGGGQTVSCPIGTLAAGGSKTVHVVVAYAGNLADGTSLKDCATVTASTDNPCATTIIRAPKLVVVKSGPATGLLNGNGTYSLVVTNTGNAAAQPSTAVDTLPAGESFVAAGSSAACAAVGQIVTCSVPALAAGDSRSFTVVVTYTQTGDLTDCATIAGQPVPSCVTTRVGTPNVVVVKTGPATGTLGGTGTYTLQATNNGSATSTPTTVFDTLPAGETFVAAGSSAACSANGQIVSCTLGALIAGTSQSFTVVVSYSKVGPLTDCAGVPGQAQESCVTTNIPGTPGLTVVKTNDANGDGIFHDTEAANAPGDPVTFRVVVTNAGNVSVVIDSVSDAFAAVTQAQCPSLLGTVLAPGQSVTCEFTLAGYAPAAGSSLTNTVTVNGHEQGNPGGTTQAADTSTVLTRQPPTPGSPDLAIVKVASDDRVRAGDTLTYTLAVSNVGDGATTGPITVTDSVPSGLDLVSVDGGSAWDCTASGRDITCTYLGTGLDPGSTAAQIVITTIVNSTAVGTVLNTGVVTTPGDTNPTNDRSTVKTPVIKVLGEKTVKNPPTQVLPFTGDRTGQMLPIGLLAVLSGLVLMVTGRRRRRTG